MARRSGGGQRGTGSRCDFHELHSVDGYTEYRSVYDAAWYVGFNRRGRGLNGRHWTRRRRGGGARARRCRQFLKTNFARADVRSRATGPTSDPSSHRLAFDLRRVVDRLRPTTTTTTTTSPTTSKRRRHRKSRDRRRRQQQQQQQQTVRTT